MANIRPQNGIFQIAHSCWWCHIYKITICLSVCLFVCLSVCLCLNAGLTAARINLIFGMTIHIWSDYAIGYMILTFEVIKDHFRSKTSFSGRYLDALLRIFI